METPFALNSLPLRQRARWRVRSQVSRRKTCKASALYTIGIHAFFINLRNPIPLQIHESPPFASPEAKSCFCFPSLWQSKRKKAELFLQRTALAEITEVLLNIGEISGVQVFIDGTKMESAADRYTFVWKKAVTKFQNRLAERSAVFVEGLELSYGIRGNFINLFPYYIYLSS